MLTYLEFDNYRFHRNKYPETKPEEWRLIFEKWEFLEKLYQKVVKEEIDELTYSAYKKFSKLEHENGKENI